MRYHNQPEILTSRRSRRTAQGPELIRDDGERRSWLSGMALARFYRCYRKSLVLGWPTSTRCINTLITTTQVQEAPTLIVTSFQLPSGTPITFRPLTPNDPQILGRYFLGLSEATGQRFGPHAFDQATADDLCSTINLAETIPLIATTADSGEERVIAYFILTLGITDAERNRYRRANISLDPRTDGSVAPSVADAFQNQKLGSSLMSCLIQVARGLGRKRIVLLGGTQATNSRAVHFYHKHGFRIVHNFEYPSGYDNYDMLLEL